MTYTELSVSCNLHEDILVDEVQGSARSTPEVELPYTELSPTDWELAVSICKGQAELYKLQHIYIAPVKGQFTLPVRVKKLKGKQIWLSLTGNIHAAHKHQPQTFVEWFNMEITPATLCYLNVWK